MFAFDTNMLTRKWGDTIKLVESVKHEKLTAEKKNALVHALENTQRRVAYKEATNPGNIGQYKKYAVDLVTAVVPNLIAFDLVAVQPLDNKSGMLNYFNYNYSNNKGTTRAGDTFNSSLNMGPSDAYYSSNMIKDEVVVKAGKAVPTSIDLDWAPVKLGTFSMTFNIGDTVVTGISDNFGNVTFSSDGQVGAVVTPAGTITFLNGVEANITGDVVVTYRYDNNSVRSDGPEVAAFTNVPGAELQIKSVPVNAETRTMRAYWAFDAEYELSKEYGQDLESLLSTQITAELAHEIDNELCLGLYDFANAAPISTWSRTPDVGVSRWEHYNGFNITMQENSASIFEATQKYGANFAVAGTQAAVVFKAQTGFEAAPNQTVAGPHLIGTVDGIKVFVNPAYKPNDYILGFKGASNIEAGAFYCPYMPVSSTDLIMDANFRGQRGWATSYGTAYINDKLYVKGTITD